MRILKILILASLLACIAVAQGSGNDALKLPQYKKVQLKNGMTLLLMENHEVPLISFNFLIKTGSTSDPAGKEGISKLTANLLRKGTKTRTADQYSAELDFIGGRFQIAPDMEFISAGAEFVKKDLNKGVDLFADAILNPTFPQDEVSKLIKQGIEGLKASKEQAGGIIWSYYNAYLYGSHPYARSIDGDEISLPAITRDDIVSFYKNYYGPNNTILTVVGDFNSSEIEKLLTDKFGAWSSKALSSTIAPDLKPVVGKRLLLVDKPDSTQTYFRIGNIGITRTNPDRVYINLINTLFGGRFTSMLNDELRVNTGLTYGAQSTFLQRKASGPFFINTYTRNATTEKAIDLTLDILKRLHEKGITEADLKSAKNYIKGQFPPQIETSDQLASTIAQLEFYGLDQRDINDLYAKIDSMTLADAQRVIKQYFPLDNLVFVVIGKSSEIETIVKKYAMKIDKKSINDAGF